jgi:phosphate:Na+ symporter
MDTIINIVGGIALLIWGIRMVRTGMTRSFGAELRKMLSVSSGNRLYAFLAGLTITSAIQSSTATAMIVASFAGQNLILTTAALAVMLGADVGTALVVQILSIDLHWLSPILIAAGVFLFLSSERNKRKNMGRIMLGIGLMLLALKLISLASAPMRESELVSVMLLPLSQEPVLTVVLIALLTWISHSSVAAILLVISLANMQVLSVQMAVTMVLGVNLGAGLPAFVMTMKSPPATRRVTLGNLIMRAVGVALVLPAVPYAIAHVGSLSDHAGQTVALAHLSFNTLLALVFLPLLSLVSSGVTRVLPDVTATDAESGPRYLDMGALETPAVALNCAARETLRMGDEVRRMLDATSKVFLSNDDSLKRQIEDADDLVDRLHEAIKLYLTRLSKEEFDALESERCIEILSFTTNLEHVGDIIDKNLMELAGKKIKERVSFSPDGQQEIRAFHERIVANLDLAMSVFMSSDLELARRLLREKTAIRDLERRYVANHYQRIADGRADSIQSSSLHIDVLRDLKRINSHLTSVVYPILERAGELAASRLVDDAQEAPQVVKPPAFDASSEPKTAN